MNRFEDGQHGNWVNGSQQRRKDEAVQQFHRLVKVESIGLIDAPDAEPDPERVEQGPDDSVEENCSQVVEEGPAGHEISGVEDDRRKDDEEEGVNVQLVAVVVDGKVEDDAEQDPDDD